MPELLLRVVRRLHRFEDALLVASLVVLIGMAVFQILLRNLFDSGLFWADSFLRVLVLWVALLGAMVATREQRHISIDLLSRTVPPSAGAWVARIVALSAAVTCGMAAWYCAAFVAIEMESSTIAFWRVPNWACELILPIGFGVMAVRFLIIAVTGVPAGDPGIVAEGD